MNELTIALTAIHTLDRVMATATETERFIYRADDWFQAHVVPVVQKTAKEILLAAFVGFVRAAYLTFVAGQSASEWYLNWFAQYVTDVPELVEESQRMLPEVAYAGYLMPAKVAEKVVSVPKKRVRKGKNERFF